MRIGLVFPQTEIGDDPSVVRDFAQAAEDTGYKQLLAYDHVLGAGLSTRPDWKGSYSEKSPFHEVMVLFGYLAGLTKSLEFVTGVLILPQRQTALVAKQSAAIDVLSGGRMRLGVGVGWNDVEYIALNEDFHTRGKRIEEQIEVLRLLWTQPAVTFKGRWHHIPDAGINPLPERRPIPLWMGAYADAGIQRAARLADGYFPNARPPEMERDNISKLKEYARAAGRDPNTFPIEARLSLRNGDSDVLRRQIEEWRGLGATHLDILTMGMGLSGRQHIEKIEQAWKDLSLGDFE